MERLLAGLILVSMAAGAEIRIDHVTVAGSSLKGMQAGLESVGIPTVYGGPHSNRATEMALASFPDGTYLELIAIQPNADPQAVAHHAWAQFLKQDGGPCAWAARSKDPAADAEVLAKAGIPVGKPARSGRTRPDGVKLDWETVQVGTRDGTFFPFLIHDFSPRKERAYPSGKPTTRDFGGVEKVVIAVRDLDEAASRYRQAYGWPAPRKQVDTNFGAHLALIGGTPVVLAAPLTADSWLARRLEQFGEAPCAFVLSARRAGKYHAASVSRWFGMDISWFDRDQLGWRLGFEE